jgi:hypothetical protein
MQESIHGWSFELFNFLRGVPEANIKFVDPYEEFCTDRFAREGYLS